MPCRCTLRLPLCATDRIFWNPSAHGVLWGTACAAHGWRNCISEARQIFDEIVQHSFFDSATRVMIIDVPFYNANLGQFISLTFIVDMPPGAGLITYSLTVEHYSAFPLRCGPLHHWPQQIDPHALRCAGRCTSAR